MGRQDPESETLIPTSGGYFDVAIPIHDKATRHQGDPMTHFQDSEFGCKEYETAAIRAGRIPEHSMVLNPAMQVRRLTPRECERLQGFPDDYTSITVRNKPAADGPRYKALGNSMAVPVMRWIGEQIDATQKLLN